MIERLLRFAYTRRFGVLLAAGGLLGAALFLVSRITFDTNIVRLLPRNSPAIRTFDTYLQRFGTFDHVYVLFEVPPDNRISDGEDFVARYVDGLRRAPEIEWVDAELFDQVKDWSYLFDRGLLLLGPADVGAALQRFRPPEMAAALAQSRGLLSASTPTVKAYVQQDPLGLLPMLRDRLAGGRALVDFDPTQTGYVSRDGRARLVMAKPVRPPFDTDFCKRLFARLAEIEAAARAQRSSAEEPPPEEPVDVSVQVAGGYRIALEAERLIRRDMVVNASTSLVGTLLLVFAAFRTLWMVLYAVVPLVLAALLVLGLFGLFGPLSPVAGGASAMLFGLGLDGVALMYVRYAEERDHGFETEEAFGRSAGTARSVMLGYGTTAATFFALTLIDFPTLRDLGVIIGVGMVACYGLLLVLLPALVGVTAPRRVRPLTVDWLGPFVQRRGRAILVASVMLTLGLGALVPRLRVNVSLETLQAHTEGTEVERRLAERFSLPQDVVLALGQGAELEPLLAAAKTLAVAADREMPSLAIASPHVLLPPEAEQREVSRVLQASRLDARDIAANFETLAETTGFRPGVFQAFVELLPRMLDPATRITYGGLIDHGLSPLVSRHVHRGPEGFLVVVYFYPKTPGELDQLSSLVTRTAPSFQLTGLPLVNRELSARFLPQFLKGITVGLLVFAAFIYCVFRRTSLTLVSFLPTAVGFVWSAGLLALFEVQIDLFSMFAAMTFIGVATDYAIHIIYRYSVERTGPIGEVLSATAGGILVAGGTTLIGFGSLATSSYGPLRAFGVVSAVTTASCIVSTLLLLPVLLEKAKRP